MKTPLYRRQFVVFLATGGTAAIVNFGSRIVYNQWTGFSTAVILAYLTGMVTAFILAKLFVFKDSKQSMQRSAVFFTLVSVVAVIQTWVVSVGLADYVFPYMHVVWHAHDLAHAAGVAFPVFTSYLGHKHWSFR